MPVKVIPFFKYANLITRHNLRINSRRIQERKFSLSSCLCKTENSNDDGKSVPVETKEKEKTLKEQEEIDAKAEEVIKRLKSDDPLYPFDNAWDRANTILKEDLKLTGRQFVHAVTGVKLGELEKKFFLRETDILVIGNGPIGLSVAYALRSQMPHGPKVMVVDKNETFPHVSTNLAQGMLTQQLFTDKEEIKMSEYCVEFLSGFSRHSEVINKPLFHVPYEPLGSLVLADINNADEIVEKSNILKAESVPNCILDIETLGEKFPWLNLDGTLFASLGLVNEGVFDPWAFLNGIKCKAVNLGVDFVNAEVIDFGTKNHCAHSAICKLPDGSYDHIRFGYCVLATGCETLQLVDKINSSDIGNLTIKLPLEKRKRYEYCFYNRDGPGLNMPILFDSNGVYFRREGLAGHYVAGVPSIPCDEDEKNSVYSVFENKVKPMLMKKIPSFDNFEFVNGWVDTYDTNLANEVGIIGPHPEETRFVFAVGFAEHGLKYAPAVGRAVMEYILYDDYRTINLSRYHIENLYLKKHLEAEEKREKLIEAKIRTAITD